MDALICDFDGVIVDSEPVHFRCFQRVLGEEGLELSREEYYTRYLGYDDYDGFALMLQAGGKSADEAKIQQLVSRKTLFVQEEFANSIEALPGAVDLLRQAELATIPIAVCSGALRNEIELAGRTVGALQYFMTVVGTDDVTQSKPSDEGYRLALARLCQLTGRVLLARRTLAIEDSPAGIAAARSAGMKVLAVTTSYGPDRLGQADKIVPSLADVTIAELEKLVG